MEKIERVISSGKIHTVFSIIGTLILALLIFHAGIVVGSRHNLFEHRNMEHRFLFSFFPGGFMVPYYGFIPNNHGSVGTITAVTLPTLSLKTRAGTNKIVLISTSTLIRGENNAGTSSLVAGDQVVVLGEPDSQGRIDAHLIHILSISATSSMP